MKILKKWSIIMYPTLSILLCFVASHSCTETKYAAEYAQLKCKRIKNVVLIYFFVSSLAT